MNRIYTKAAFFFSLVVIFSFAGQTFAQKGNLEMTVAKKLRYVMDYGVFDHIAFQVYNGGVVTLTGKVYSLGTIGRAKSTIEDIPGVTKVVNNIEQLTGSGYDDTIRRQLIREISERGPGQYFSEIAPDVHLVVDNGRITIEGFVNNRSDANMLTIIANSIPGVFEVTNNLVIGKPVYR